MKMYKGFNKDLKCRDFQYEIGKTYEESTAELCESGFHACERPLDVFKYYAPGKMSRYCEVNLDDVSDQMSNDSKRCGKKISVKAEIGIAGLVRAQIQYVNEHTTMKHTDPKHATAGDFGAATAGESGAATAGESGAATAGQYGAATAGDFGAATAGESGAATAGESGAATAGEYGAATAGDFGAATAGESGAATAGKHGAATAGDFGAATAGESGAATAGKYGAATAGDFGAATAGESGAATAGESGAATAGESGAATAGDFGAATAGKYGAATAGKYGAATAGKYGAATSRGYVSVGENGCGLVRGENVKIKGGMGAILVIAVENDADYGIKEWKAFVVDGENIKPDTWYKLKNGDLVEVSE